MDRNIVILALCRLTRKKPEEIQDHFSLASLGVSSSFGLSALRSKLESESRSKLPPFTSGILVKDLLRLFLGEAGERIPPPSPASSKTSASAPSMNLAATSSPQQSLAPGNIGLGLDMQEVEDLPIAEDFRIHEFYASHFSQEEIATAMLRPDPRVHLCGIFCAKEAVKKSHADLLNLRMSEIAVDHDTTGRPKLRLIGNPHLHERFRFLLSITHTARFAAATCLSLWSDR